MKFSVIIPTVNKTDIVKNCVESIYKYTKSKEMEIIIVDDGSNDDVKRYIDSNLRDPLFNYKWIKIIHKKNNTGFSDTVNHGISQSTGDAIILVNNDSEFKSDIFEAVENAFKKDERIGIVGALLLYPNDTVQHAGIELKDKIFYHVDKGIRAAANKQKSRYCPAVTGAIFAVKRECLNDVGIFDVNYFISCDDTDYCLRAWQRDWRVWYEASAVAMHIEGASRGNTEAIKNRDFPFLAKKEREAIAMHAKKFSDYDYKALQRKVNDLNAKRPRTMTPEKKIKIEIGSGYNPQMGYVHIDSRKLPGTDHVLNFESQRLPFGDSSVDEILTNHCIEHISWRSLPFVFREWYRVLKNGGRVFLRTPDLEFICKTYLDNKTTKEWPGDENFIKEHFGSVTPAWWANIKFFAGQDYAENYHCLCFDFQMLKSCVEKFGFKNVKRLNIEPVYSPGEIQAEFFK